MNFCIRNHISSAVLCTAVIFNCFVPVLAEEKITGRTPEPKGVQMDKADTASIPSIRIADVLGLGQPLPVVEEISGVERSISVEFVQGAVEPISTRLLVGADHCSVASAVLSAHAVRQNREVLDGLERGMNVDSAFAKVVVVISAV